MMRMTIEQNDHRDFQDHDLVSRSYPYTYSYSVPVCPLIVTIACGVIIVILFLGEYFDYRSVHVESSLIVDTGRKEKMDIELDITFPKIPCYSNVKRPRSCFIPDYKS